MLEKKDCYLGIDTSNYKTTLAVINYYGEKLIDIRKTLEVKEGKRGLRQSEAVFQHMKNLPDIFDELSENFNPKRLKSIAVSSRPRNIEGSYMPVFLVGHNYGRVLSKALNIPIDCFSHQEGHLEAGLYDKNVNREKFLAAHLSGGTCEFLKIEKTHIEIIGKSLDISYGQLLDRVGVALGLPFPSGEYLDKIAIKSQEELLIKNTNRKNSLPEIKIKELDFNISGIESACQRNLNNEFLILDIFERIAESLIKVIKKACKKEKTNEFLLTGGVSASNYIKNNLTDVLQLDNINLIVNSPSLCADNAIGIALLGRKLRKV